jgi:hypothetical protein
VVLIAFLLVSPVAMLFMLGGGLLGWNGILLFPQIPWALFTWIGSLVGKRWMKIEKLNGQGNSSAFLLGEIERFGVCTLQIRIM